MSSNKQDQVNDPKKDIYSLIECSIVHLLKINNGMSEASINSFFLDLVAYDARAERRQILDEVLRDLTNTQKLNKIVNNGVNFYSLKRQSFTPIPPFNLSGQPVDNRFNKDPLLNPYGPLFIPQAAFNPYGPNPYNTSVLNPILPNINTLEEFIGVLKTKLSNELGIGLNDNQVLEYALKQAITRLEKT